MTLTKKIVPPLLLLLALFSGSAFARDIPKERFIRSPPIYTQRCSGDEIPKSDEYKKTGDFPYDKRKLSEKTFA